jgi:type I restriction enzyme M protein
MTKEQLKQLETDLWSAADNLRANSDLKSSEYAIPEGSVNIVNFGELADTQDRQR